MTLNAVLYADTFPIVVSDSLVSNPNGDSLGVASPLLSWRDMREGLDKNKPVGLARKFWLLPDRTIFLYSGTIDAAYEAFVYLKSLVDECGSYDLNTFRQVQRFIENNIRESFSFMTISPPRDSDSPLVLAHGKVTERDVPNYGLVVVIGSGVEPFFDALNRCSCSADIGEPVLVANAYAVAARATIDYMERDSKFSGKSTGGYFEVLVPRLWENEFSWVYRGTAHVFVEIFDNKVLLQRLVVSRQTDKYTEVLASKEVMTEAQDSQIVVSNKELCFHKIASKREESTETSFDGVPSFRHIMAMVFYVTQNHPCGHISKYNKVVFSDEFAVATFSEYDGRWWDQECDEVLPSICLTFLDTTYDIGQLALRASIATCCICNSGSIEVK